MACSASGSYNWYEETCKKENGVETISAAACASMRRSSCVLENGIIETTPGRVIFNTIVPKELGFQNYSSAQEEDERARHAVL